MEHERELAALIQRMTVAAPLSPRRAQELHRAAYSRALPAVLGEKEAGDAVGQLSILNQSETEFRANLSASNDDLGRQIEIVGEALDLWFKQGSLVPPHYPWRIATILSKQKRKAEEAAFLRAWCRHFGDRVGGRFDALKQRAAKLGAV